MPADLPFQLLERYDVIEEIGRGGHAVVYRAHDRVLGRDVAVKFLREDVVAPDIRARFTQEIQVMATLEHPHILHVHDSGMFGDAPFVVMALAPSQTLAHRLQREPQLPVADAVQITREVGSALAHAHARGVLHRDVKPSNILLSDSGAILADFGIARVTGELEISRITSTGEAVGTLQYMSPEQLCAEPVDARSDQYALACVLYEMLAGTHPHPAATFEALRALRLMGRQQPIAVLRPSVPPLLAEVIARAMAVTPADRFRSMDEMLVALDLTRTGDASVVSVTGDGVAIRRSSAGHDAIAAPVARRRSWWLGGLAVAGAAAVVAWQSGALGAPSADGPSVSVSFAGDSIASAFGERVTRELQAWNGLSVVSRGALRVAASATVLGDSVQLRLDGDGVPLFPVDSGAVRPSRVQVSRMVLRAALPSADGVVAAMVREVLAGVPAGELPGLEGLPSRSVAALRAFVRGHALVRAGQLDSAAQLFRSARDLEPRFAQARFWAAQSAAWSAPKAVDRWKSDADEAVRIGTLRGVDSLLALGLQHMAAMEFPEACNEYRAATERDAGSFVGWFGLGECQRLDPAVILQTRVLQYRTSPWNALRDFQRAVRLAPASGLLSALYPTVVEASFSNGNQLRAGRNDSTRFAALPQLSSDTIAFVPLPVEKVSDPSSVPLTHTAAIRLARKRLVDLSLAWTERFPESTSASIESARALELAGLISRDDRQSADAVIRGLLTRALSVHERSLAEVTLVRLALRRSEFAHAVELARSSLIRVSSDDPETGSPLLSIATFVGDSATLFRLATPDSARRQDLAMRAAESIDVLEHAWWSGDCERTRVALREAEVVLESSLSPAELRPARIRWLLPVVRFSVPCLGVRAIADFPAQFPLDSALKAILVGRNSDARQILARLRSARKGTSVGAVTWDYLNVEAWATLAAGDSTAGWSQYTSAIEDIGNMSVYTLSTPAQAAGLRDALLRVATGPSTSRDSPQAVNARRNARSFLQSLQ